MNEGTPNKLETKNKMSFIVSFEQTFEQSGSPLSEDIYISDCESEEDFYSKLRNELNSTISANWKATGVKMTRDDLLQEVENIRKEKI